MPRNFLWSERLRSSDQTTWAVQAMNRPLAFMTNGISALEFNCLDRRMNAPLRLSFSVVPSTMPVGALIEAGHFTLALVWRRLSVPITACEIICRRFFVVLLQKVLNWIQITGIRGTDATKKPPSTEPVKDGRWGQYEIVALGDTQVHFTCLIMQTRCQEKAPTDQSS